MAYDVKEMEQYIRQAARARGIDPDTAVRVARSEGLARGTWQSNVKHPTRGREPSYGPFQLLEGGRNGWPTGMGNDFRRQTGLDPSDPANARAGVDFALDGAARNGWGAWYGAKHAGIGNRQGLDGAKALGMTLASNPVAGGRGTINPPLGPLAPPLGAPRTIADAPIGNPITEDVAPVRAGLPSPEAPEVNPMDVFKNEGFMAGMKALGGSDAGKAGMGLLASAFGGGGSDPQAEAHNTPIQSTLPAMEGADAGRMAAAQQLMQSIMMNKRGGKVPGLSLMG